MQSRPNFKSNGDSFCGFETSRRNVQWHTSHVIQRTQSTRHAELSAYGDDGGGGVDSDNDNGSCRLAQQNHWPR